MSFEKKNYGLNKRKLIPLIPKLGGGLSMETYLWIDGKNKYIVRKCNSDKKAESYEAFSKKLSKYKVVPKLIRRKDRDMIYQYLQGRDLEKKESLKIFEEIGKICAKFNKLNAKNVEIDLPFDNQLNQLETGDYKKFTSKEMMEKRKRRPNERHDVRRIKPLITKEEKEKIKNINKALFEKTKIKFCLDAVDVSPANFRLSGGNIYFVDIEGIRKTMMGVGLAKAMWGWAETKNQRQAIMRGYFSLSKQKSSKEFLNLIKLHYIIQSLHDRIKIGRNYKKQLLMLKSFLANYPKD
jgi:hypothetical protein